MVVKHDINILYLSNKIAHMFFYTTKKTKYNECILNNYKSR